jgi:hypothetical protein
MSAEPDMFDWEFPYTHHHARLRARERLGFDPTPADWRDAALAILNTLAAGRTASEEAMLVRLTGAAEVWRIPIATRQALVVWSPKLASIITVLPPK